MRRKDRQITDIDTIKGVIDSCSCCRLGFCDNGKAYIVPLNFGYEEKDGKFTFYFHSALVGRKVDLLKASNDVSFEMDCKHEVRHAEVACDYSAWYNSVMGEGKTTILTENEEKRAALLKIMATTTGKTSWTIPDLMLKSVCVFKLEVTELSCKIHDANR